MADPTGRNDFILPSTIEKFFSGYAASFLADDAGHILSVYEFPVNFYCEDGETVSLEKAVFSENTRKLIDIYKEIGTQNVAFTIEGCIRLSGAFSLVSVIWQFLDLKGAEIYHATTRYLVKQELSGLLINSVFVVDETGKLNALRSRKNLS